MVSSHVSPGSNYGSDSVARSLLHDYAVPPHFPEDLFSLVGERRRPPYRWFLLGPAAAGSGLAEWAAAGAPQAAAAILVITALAVGLEQLSAYGLDNLSVPLAVGLLWSLLKP